MSEPILMPAMTEAQEEAWHTLLDLYDDLPVGWTVVGGQMVHMWCAERGSTIARPTDDADAVLDVRARPKIHYDFTAALWKLGFEPETQQSGVQHRWRRGEAMVDVLIPRHLGLRAAGRPGAGGGRTIETPGAQKVLNRTEVVQVRIGDRTGSVPRPALLGALIGKAAAFTVELDNKRHRHLGDLTVLATLLRPSDVADYPALDRRERRLLANGIGNARIDVAARNYVPQGDEALDRLTLAIQQPAPARARPARGMWGRSGP